MASNSLSRSLQTLRITTGCLRSSFIQCRQPQARGMATETVMPANAPHLSRNADPALFAGSSRTPSESSINPDVPVTIYSFPSMEPLRYEYHPASHLHLPLRRDLLHRAVIYEGDATRQGTASTKTRWEIHGSHRKIRPQKGSGRARLGTKQSPMLRGGSKAFGPKPRDFSSELPQKMYDLAWRTALSYRYRKGELIVCEDGMDIEYPKTRYIKQIFQYNHWGNADGRSLVITGSFRKNLFRALRHAGEDGRIEKEDDVDVKNLLEMGRVIIEKKALDSILRSHSSDL